jgi:tape measure domain-containing protein|nr:MAG TPA: tail tape measure [Caudoviricetes sp.]
MAANGARLAQAYVEIVPSMKGVGTAISKAFGGASESIGRSEGVKLGASLSTGLGSKLGAVTGVANNVAGRVIDAFSGLAGEITSASDSAQKFGSTLRFAGTSDKQIKALTKSTQDYADKTVYDLNDIRNTTAQLAANGVPNYARLAEAAGNLNAVAGGSSDTFRSVAMVLTQTAGAGKLTTENWNQLADAIPGASGKLQEAMLKNGAYTGNFRDAMAKGEITADEFNQAIMQLGMTDAAKEAATSTTTIEGALGNLEAAAVKAGVTVLDSVKPMVTGAMNGVSDALTAVTPLIQNTIQGTIAWFRDLYGKLRDNGALTAFKSAWDTIRNAIMGVVNMVIDWVRLAPPDTLANAIKFVADALNWFLAHGNTLIPIIIGIGTAFAAVKGYQALNNGLTALTNTMNAVTKTATGVSNGILTMMDLGGPVQMIGQLAGKMKLAQTAQAAWSAATKAATAVQGAFNAVMAMTGGPITLAIAAIVAALSWFFTQTETGRQTWGAFTSWLSQTWTTLVEGAKTLWQGLSDFFTGLWETISATAQTAWNTISSVVTPIVQAIGEFIKNVFIVLAAVLVTVWNGISNVVTTVWNAIRSFLEPLVQGIADFITNAVNAISSVWNSVWNSISSFFATVWNAMVAFYTPIINGIRNTIGNVVNAIRGTWNSVWSGISGFFSNIWNGMRNAVSNAVNAIGGTVGRIWGIVTGALGGAGNWLYDTGRQIIQGLINGIGGAFQWVKNTISNLGRSVVSWAKSVLHIGSPSRVFADEVGKWIPAGMAQGITENTGVVQKGIDKLTDMVPSIHVATEFDDPDALQYAQINGGFDVSASRSGRANVGNGGGSTTYVTQTFNYPAIAPTSISTQQRLQTAAMPQW